MDSPIVAASLQAGLISALSNILAQSITAWRSGLPLSINTVDLFQFVLFSVLACPPNVIWQNWLEAQYPAYGRDRTPLEKEALVDQQFSAKGAANGHTNKRESDRKADTTEESQPKSLNVKNTAIKFALDQTLGAAGNTILFIAGIGLIRGQPSGKIMRDLQAQFWPMIFAGQRFWPLVSILSFTLIPLEYRMLLGNSAGFFWSVYLSLVAGAEA